MQSDNSIPDTGKSSNGGWTLVAILVIIATGWLFFSQAKDKSDYNDALRVTGAKVECRAEAKREGLSEAEAGCDKLGTPGRAGALPAGDDAGGAGQLAVVGRSDVGGAQEALGTQLGA